MEFKDIKKIAISLTQMWSAALGKPVEMREELIRDSFDKFSGSKDSFNEQE